MAAPVDRHTETRRSLHALAELVVAGPRFRATGDLRLRVRPDGIGTWDAPVVALSQGDLVLGAARFGVEGLTIAEVAARAGLEPSPLDDVYADGTHVAPSERVHLDAEALQVVEDAFHLGEESLHVFSPESERILWPEHFDLAITVDSVNYGVSPGDAYLDRPYAYVGPHEPVAGAFWNAPFGAARLLDELGDAPATTAFFREGQELVTRSRA